MNALVGTPTTITWTCCAAEQPVPTEKVGTVDVIHFCPVTQSKHAVTATVLPPLDEPCACGRPEQCWPGATSCAHADTGYVWCTSCQGHHRPPVCP